MNPDFKLTEIEQKVLTETRHLFGSNLVDYLLSGLGESKMTHCRAFTAQLTSPQGEDVTYRFEIRNESSQGLPMGREPLVMAVLLNLFRERQPMDDAVTFRASDILEKLDWPQTTEIQLMIKQAIEKYVSTAYCLVDPTVSEDERSSSLYAVFMRLLVGYQTTSKLLPQKRTDMQRFIKVGFTFSFLNAIMGQRKQFLGIEFQNLQEMREIPCLELWKA
jgi:hypothetical protein